MMSSRQPRVTGISPLQGSPGTKVTIRGEKLGRNAEDFQSVEICGIDCTLSSEWVSPSKIIARPGLCQGEGDILVTTKSGGVGKSLVKFLCHIPEKVGLLDDSGVFLEEDEDDENSPLPEVDVFNILSDSYPPLPNDSCNLNLSSFSPEELISQVYSSVSFDSLKSGLEHLKTQLIPHARAPFDSLKRNISLHFECYRKLKELSSTLTGESFKNDLHAFSHLHECVDKCFSTLLSRHDLVERNRQLITNFNRWRNLFSLPSNLEKNIARGNYREAVDDFERAKRTHSSTGDNSVLSLIFAHSERQITKLKATLRQSLLGNHSLSIHEQSHALVISADPSLVAEFLLLQYDNIKDRLAAEDSDPLHLLNSLSQDMSRLFPNFKSLCDFCQSLSMGDHIEELASRLPPALLKAYLSKVGDILPSIETRTDPGLDVALHSHRRTALTLPSGEERPNLSRLSRSARLSCLNCYFNICLSSISRLFEDYMADDSPALHTHCFPNDFCRLIQEQLELANERVILSMSGELDFFETSASTSTLSRRFAELFCVYTRGLKRFLQSPSHNWRKLVLLHVDADFMALSGTKQISALLEQLRLPRIDVQMADFVKALQRRQEELFKKLVVQRSSVSPLKYPEIGGINSKVHSLLTNIVGLCAELGLISVPLLRRVLGVVCDDFVRGVLGGRMDLRDLVAVRILCGGLCSEGAIRQLNEEIGAGDEDLGRSFRERFAVQLEAISYCVVSSG